MTSVILSADLGNFFRGEVTEATQSLGIKLSEDTEYYLVNLLCEFSRSGAALRPGDEPLAFIYKRALEAETYERISILKNLGDLALYVGGFFAEFIERSLVDLDYYISMGGAAYNSLSDIMGHQPQGENFARLYETLAKRFASLVDILMAIADRGRGTSDDDLLRLYSRWTQTRSERVHRKLVEKGLLFSVKSPDEELQ